MQKKVAGLTEAALETFVARAQRAAGLDGDVDVLVTSNARIRTLNQRFRGKDKATDVLSFPAIVASFDGDGSHVAGDIAISADIAGGNATRFGHTDAEEIKILVLHGILHLAGLDHERDNGGMARREARLRQVLKLPPALIERVHAGKSSLKKKSRKRPRAGAAKV